VLRWVIAGFETAKTKEYRSTVKRNVVLDILGVHVMLGIIIMIVTGETSLLFLGGVPHRLRSHGEWMKQQTYATVYVSLKKQGL